MTGNKKVNMSTTFRILLLWLLLLGCSSSMKIKVLGFAYQGEEVLVKTNDRIIMRFKVEGAWNKDNVCSLNEELNVPIKTRDIVLQFIILYNDIKVLDTLISIPKGSKEPFISIQYPEENNKYKRSLFVADVMDSLYIKY